jgi:hypothetical protein
MRSVEVVGLSSADWAAARTAIRHRSLDRGRTGVRRTSRTTQEIGVFLDKVHSMIELLSRIEEAPHQISMTWPSVLVTTLAV